ncbi:MAG: DUF1829 domain-containing protein, partial [Spirochaetales bacterium]|nr:DUF1829 domain-containing protein [Candidatus Physcosoma equi]
VVKYVIDLPEKDRKKLNAVISKGHSPAKTILRAKHLCSYTPDYMMKGRLLEYRYDFFVQGRQESLIRLLPEVNDDSKMLTLLEWQDVIKDNDSPLYAIGKVEDKPKTSIGKKISKAMDENNIISLSYEKDKKAIEQYIMAIA